MQRYFTLETREPGEEWQPQTDDGKEVKLPREAAAMNSADAIADRVVTPPKEGTAPMTRLTPNKPLRRLTDTRDKGDQLVIELHPLYLRIRPKGAKIGYDLSYTAIYDCARKLDAREKLRLKGRNHA